MKLSVPVYLELRWYEVLRLDLSKVRQYHLRVEKPHSEIGIIAKWYRDYKLSMPLKGWKLITESFTNDGLISQYLNAYGNVIQVETGVL